MSAYDFEMAEKLEAWREIRDDVLAEEAEEAETSEGCRPSVRPGLRRSGRAVARLLAVMLALDVLITA